ncbi:MAG: valine--tRNA ligase [candidate division KSB1 bacterium]|nr:valine--tRNA ligase [candidate division KSB1 bacterium]
MSGKNIDKVYDPKKVEDKWYEYWQRENYFHAEVNPQKTPYTIVIPPPNVTDVLHMGHAYNNTIQDILIRFRRMQGYETLWLPGTDHAGIATQNVVERKLWKDEQLTRHDLGREKFVERVWQWRQKYGSIIIEQLKKLGCSCDWARERFTMDEGLSRAVLEVFVRLYRKGLIYRGKYIINWCPRCQTALSDEEAIHQEHEGKLWYIKYPLKGSSNFITVATTRPETMLGDVAVAVHPQDPRYKALIGKIVILPVLERPIPIIGDEQVDSEFGTGAVKVTPAHDPNDFEIGNRHGLTPINVMNGDGTMNENAGKYNGFDRFECRKKLVEELKAKGLLEKIEGHSHAVAHCQRCDTILEPYLSEQWFVKVKPLAEPALRVVQEGQIKLHPDKWVKVYTNWMENIRDWCISRQLWWGHRIPVYYCLDCQEMMVAVDAPKECTQCGSQRIRQDEDVLDTWFSSWLWPFSTMGWPEETPELKYFYPTDTLVTAPEILFFWVARMIMAGLEFMGQIPFKDVYLHGIVRDEFGRKMSKSLGNGIDPLEMVEKYSADAVRFSLLMLTSEGQDINLAERDFEIGRNFSNKIWNAFRFLALNMEDEVNYVVAEKNLSQLAKAELCDRWILSRFTKTAQKVTQTIENFKLNETIDALYSFFWHEYCDWYLELIKPRLYGQDAEAKKVALTVAINVMRGILKLLHPFIPFITEEIWQTLKQKDEKSLIVSPWVHWDETLISEQAEKELGFLQAVIGAIRNIRGEMNVPPNKKAEVLVKGTDDGYISLIQQNQSYLYTLANVERLTLGRDFPKPRLSASAVVGKVEVYVPLEGLIDIAVERNRLQKEVDRLGKQLDSLNKKLTNPDFLSRAPEEVIAREKKKKEDFTAAFEKLQRNLMSLEED